MRRVALVAALALPGAAVGLVAGLSKGRGRESPEPALKAVARLAESARGPERLLLPMTDEEENELGRALAAEIRSFPSDRVEKVGYRLLPAVKRTKIDYRFEVVESPAENAFALPGGRVYVTSGMLAAVQSDDELAGVIGHEIAHVELMHCADQVRVRAAAKRAGVVSAEILAELVGLFLDPAYSEEQERAADRYGVMLASKAGYDRRGLIDFFWRTADTRREVAPPPPKGHRPVIGILGEGLRRYFETHPGLEERAEALERGD